MKINLLNLSCGNNYGAILQAYALQETLKKHHHNVFTIKYWFSPLPFYIRIMKYIYLFMVNVEYRKKIIYRISGEMNQENIIHKRNVYEMKAELVFNERYQLINFIEAGHSVVSDLKKLPPVDAVICGSDVVWAFRNYSHTISIFFLDWVQPGVKRIAYAPSWGRSNIDHLNNFTKRKISKLLAKFDAVSVREKTGVDICASLGRTDAKWVPDPTILLTENEWNLIAESTYDGEYCLNYHIPYNASIESSKILSLLQANYIVPIKNIPDINTEDVWISPTKWLGAIRDAKFVVTNSFHGVVFCLLYHKNFIFTELIGEHVHLNERIYSLLGLFNLKDRIATTLTANDEIAIKKLLDEAIDWETVDIKMKEWRQVGIDFLDEALKKATQKEKCSEN